MDTEKNITLAEWKPTIRQILNVLSVLRSGRLTYGPYTRQLEKQFAKLHHFRHAIFMNSGTSALHVAWQYLKMRNQWPDNAEVLVPSVTFVATVNVLLHNRLKPVLVDVDPATCNIDPNQIEKKITTKTVAICPVDLLGRPCNIVAIRAIAEKHKLLIVEDACETMFVTHDGIHPVGSKANIACYSSYLAHIISTGVGGFLCTNSKRDADYMRSMIWHGRDNLYLSIDANKTIPIEELITRRFLFNKPGHSFRLTELEAAIGVDELNRSKEIIEARKKNAQLLHDELLPYVNYIQLFDGNPDNAWMFFPMILRYGDRDTLMIYLEHCGIQTRTIMPLTRQPIFRGLWNPDDYPVADVINNQGFLIGVHHYLTKKDIKYISQCFFNYFI